MKTYTMQEACNALAVDSATLYRWMVRAGMFAEVTKQKDEQDKRRRMLSQAQVTQLARLHHRSLAQQQPVKPDVSEIAELRDRIEALEREVSKVRTTLASLTASTGNPVPPSQKTPRNASQRVVSSGVGSQLPDGLVVLRSFADMHGIPATTALRNEHLPRITGKWKLGRAYVTQALDAGGRAAFYRLYSEHKRFHERFTPCPDCPHVEVTAE